MVPDLSGQEVELTPPYKCGEQQCISERQSLMQIGLDCTYYIRFHSENRKLGENVPDIYLCISVRIVVGFFFGLLGYRNE